MTQILSDDEYAALKQSHPELQSGCPTCDGRTYYRWKGVSVDCDCNQQRQLYVRYAHAGIGKKFMQLSWEDLSLPKEQLDPIQAWLEQKKLNISRGRGLFLSGAVGTGKTLVLNLVLKEVIKADIAAYFTTFSGMVESFTSTWGDNEEKKRFATRFMRTRVLGLDDLGKEFRSANRLSATTFDHVLRTRVFEDRTTLLTSNLSSKEVQIGYGAAVLSLLAEQNVHVHFEGQDFRVKAHDRTGDEIAAGETRPIV